MPMPLSQMVDVLKDAMVQGVSDALVQSITKPAIRQDLYNDVANEQINIELKKKHFSTKDMLFITDVKKSVFDTISLMNPEPMILLQNAIVAGGCFASLFHSKKANDYDIFILQNDINRETLYVNLMAHIKENPSRWKHMHEDDVAYLKNNNIDLVFTYEHMDGYYAKFQYIFTKFKTREELINDFDFVHCCTSMTLRKDDAKLYVTPETFEAIKNKTLTKNPKCNRLPRQWRVNKFVEQGWKNNVLKTCD